MREKRRRGGVCSVPARKAMRHKKVHCCANGRGGGHDNDDDNVVSPYEKTGCCATIEWLIGGTYNSGGV